MPLIGTAGHVDHGKSTLIERLSGRDPDRWKEEKDRGLTIDLGFAWASLPSGIDVSFVDVPGHERYMKNMLAGIEAIDIALLVVAADESWMPQTEEHVAVLDLLEVNRGVVALTKRDLVDDDLADLAALEVEDKLSDTSLSGATIVAVSAKTGEGVDELVAEIDRLATEVAESDGDRPRLWIDRSFPISGAGTVVTGSLLGGALNVDEKVEIYPGNSTARIRGIQSHEQSVRVARAGRRVAMNLAGVDHMSVGRGDMAGRAGQWDVTTRFSARLRPARYVEELDQRGAYTIHVGSASQPVVITGRSDRSVVFQLQSPLPLTAGDRFVVRDTGRRLVVGGGRVVDISPTSTGSALGFADDLSDEFEPDAMATLMLRHRHVDTVLRLANHSNGGHPAGAVSAGESVLDPLYADGLRHRALDEVSRYHRNHPLRPGLPLATLAERLGVETAVAEMVLDETSLVRHGPDVAVSDFEPTLAPEGHAAWEEAVTRLAKTLAVPDEGELGLDPETIALKIRQGELVRIAPNLVFLPHQIDELRSMAEQLETDFTAAEFRDATSLSRKYVIPILEWMDKEGLTVRRGDRRSIR